MPRMNLTALTAAALITLSTPVFAQMGSTAAPTGAGKMGLNTTTGAASAASSDNSMPMNCQAMMDKAHPMMDGMADGNKKTMAMKQMDMATTAMSAGKEGTCIRHMKSAMNDMM